MSRIKIICLLLSVLLPDSVSAVDRMIPHRMPKNIQKDGFLLEWDLDSEKYFSGDSALKWNAAVTPQGLAGYFRVERTDVLDGWLFRIYPQTGIWHKHSEISFRKPSDFEKSVYSFSFNGDDKISFAVSEWLLPWDLIPVDTNGVFSSGIICVTPENDTLDAVVLEGNKNGQNQGGIMTPKIIGQLIMIAVLLFLYFFIRFKVIKKKKRQINTF